MAQTLNHLYDPDLKILFHDSGKLYRVCDTDETFPSAEIEIKVVSNRLKAKHIISPEDEVMMIA